MTRKSTSLEEQEMSDLIGFLVEFARLLLAAGVSSDQFSKLAQLAFLRAAASDARFSNDRINQSAVAAMTGLNRTQVRSLLKRDRPASRTRATGIERVISAWMSEAEFLTATGSPKSLKLSGPRGSFSLLVKKHGGDVPPKALLRELTRRNFVRVADGRAILVPSARRNYQEKRLGQISNALESVLKRPNDQQEVRSVKVATFEVSHDAPTPVGRVLLRKRLSKSLQAFMAEVEAACAAVALETPPAGDEPKRKTKTGVLLITQD